MNSIKCLSFICLITLGIHSYGMLHVRSQTTLFLAATYSTRDGYFYRPQYRKPRITVDVTPRSPVAQTPLRRYPQNPPLPELVLGRKGQQPWLTYVRLPTEETTTEEKPR